MRGYAEEPDDQTATIAALERLVAASDPPCRRADTHISHLFLGRTRAYKLKRAVRLPFADFATVEARRRACQSELAVNRVLAPGLYEAVLPITAAGDGTLQLDGDGEPVDWVVSMRRFADGALLDEMAEAGTLSVDLVQKAVQAIARFHATLEPKPEAGHTSDYHAVITQLRRTEADGAGRMLIQPGSDALFTALERALAHVSPIIEQRRRAGWVRRGHGDLHLRNICLFEGRVTPFDALEFDARLATTDVLYDVAFLFMDLRRRGLVDHVNVALNGYWDALGQPESALALLPFFMGLRAAVKMAVAVEAGDLDGAARYRRLGLELLQPAVARLVAVGGLSGSGKSTLARSLAPHLGGPCGARLLRTDTLRQTATAATSGPRYSAQVRAAVYDRLALAAAEALAAGAPVIADATFREAAFRDAIEAAAQGHAFHGLWLRAPAAWRAERVRNRKGDASEATAEVALAQAEPQALGQAWLALQADIAPAELARAALRSLAGRAINGLDAAQGVPAPDRRPSSLGEQIEGDVP